MAVNSTDFSVGIREALERAQQRVEGVNNQSEAEAIMPAKSGNPYFKSGKATVPVASEKQCDFEKIFGKEFEYAKDRVYTVYDKEDWPEHIRELIPVVEEDYDFDAQYAFIIAECIEHNKTGFAYGPPGTGKTKGVEQVCARLNYPFMFISGMGGTEPADYVGTPWVEDGSMSWRDAKASFAVRHGVFLLYDEPFKSSGSTNMCFQSLLDDRRTLNLYGHPDAVNSSLKAHEKFRFFQADNVRGHGDQMDKFAAEVQDQSTLNRVEFIYNLGYPTKEAEYDILAGIYPEASEYLIKKTVQLAGLIREGWDNDTISLPFSIRNTKSMVQATLEYGDPAFAFRVTYMNGIADEDELGAVKKVWDTVGFKETNL